jgi:hypothetical protein
VFEGRRRGSTLLRRQPELFLECATAHGENCVLVGEGMGGGEVVGGAAARMQLKQLRGAKCENEIVTNERQHILEKECREELEGDGVEEWL